MKKTFLITVFCFVLLPLMQGCVDSGGADASRDEIVISDNSDSVYSDNSDSVYVDGSRIAVGMTYDEITKVLGEPDRQITYGLMVMQYDLPDGSHLNINYLTNSGAELYAADIEVVID